MIFKLVERIGKSGQVFLIRVSSLALTSCKSLLLLVQTTFLDSEGEERKKGGKKKKGHGKVAHRNTLCALPL